MKSFLLMGQSNMAGRGDFGEVPEIINRRCWMLRNGRPQPMKEPINVDRPIFSYFHSGVGLSASFADAFANRFEEDVLLIPCADGGTALREWVPGGLLFDHAVMQTRLAMRSSELAGILWHQGENDAAHPERVAVYKEKFLEMANALRAELGQGNIPILIGGLSDWNGDMGPEMNEILEDIPNHLANTAFVSATGLGHRGDHVHFSSPAYREFGLRYFDAYCRLLNKE